MPKERIPCEWRDNKEHAFVGFESLETKVLFFFINCEKPDLSKGDKVLLYFFYKYIQMHVVEILSQFI